MKTDLELQQDVIEELQRESSVNAADLGVEVHQGVVTLSGHVVNFAEKIAAERATQRVAGVKALTIRIEIMPASCGGPNDIDIARSAQDALRGVTYMPKDSVKVMVENGWITLSGEVEGDYQRRNAVDTVSHLAGVKGVSDIVRLRTQPHSDEVKRNIEAALERHGDAGHQHISVAVQGDAVTLSGTVTDWWQLDSAREAAWNAPGVRHVANQLTIEVKL